VAVTLRSAKATGYSRILALGGVRGENTVPNDDLVGPIESSDEWIRRRTGIVSRRRAPRDVLVQDMAEQANAGNGADRRAPDRGIPVCCRL